MDSAYLAAIALLVAMQAFDWWTTDRCVYGHGFREANPFVAQCMARFGRGGWWLPKAMLSVMAVGLFCLAGGPTGLWGLAAANVVLLAAAGHNALLLREARRQPRQEAAAAPIMAE